MKLKKQERNNIDDWLDAILWNQLEQARVQLRYHLWKHMSDELCNQQYGTLRDKLLDKTRKDKKP